MEITRSRTFISTVGLFVAGIALGTGAGWSAGCGGGGPNDNWGSGGSGGAGGSAGFGGTGTECQACKTGSDCAAGYACAQIQGDTFCVAECSTGGCGSGTTCGMVTSYNGSEVTACVPDNNACSGGGGPGPEGGAPPPKDSGCPPPPACDAGSPGMCGSLAGPTVSAGCSSCSGSSSSCQPNGCYGGWWCNTASNSCQEPPEAGSCPSSPMCPPAPPCNPPPPPPSDSGAPPPPGSVTSSGGTLGTLVFAVVGDTRPANEDDTAGYPTSIITQIFNDINSSSSPSIPFVVSTGDYMFANPSGSEASKQLALYMGARKGYSGVVFPAMGNHECTGYTASNCGPGGTDGITNNYTAFLTTMLSPIGQTKPYYSININSTTGAWTAKFVFVAANAWDSAQSSWLKTTMAAPTTYTFVMRHEESSASTAPGVSPSDSIINSYPYTLLIVGHSHSYYYASTNQVIMGNGGAPLTGGGNYGYGLIQQLADGNISIDMMDYMTMSADSSFHTVVTPTGMAGH